MMFPVGKAKTKTPLHVQICRGLGYAVVLIAPTWLFFAPMWSFHHTLAFGLLAPLVIDGEEPVAPLPFFLGWAEVHLFPGRLLFSLLLWFVCLHYGRKVVNWLSRPA